MWSLSPHIFFRTASVPGYGRILETENGGTLPVVFFPEFETAFALGGFELTAQMLLTLGILVVFFWGIMKNRWIRTQLDVSYLILLCFMIFSVITQIVRGNNGAISGLYIVSGIAVLVVFRDYPFRTSIAENQMDFNFESLIKSISILILVGVISNHVIFLFTPILAMLTVAKRVSIQSKVLYLLTLIRITYNSTFTIYGLVCIGLLVSVIYRYRKNIDIVAFIKLLYTLYFSFLVLVVLFRPDLEGFILSDNLRAKIFDDRYYVWIGTIKSFGLSNVFMPNEGFGSLKYLNFMGDERIMSYGSHNVLLNQMRFMGLVPGLVYFILVYRYLLNAARMVSIKGELYQLLFLSLIICFFIYGLTNHSVTIHPVSMLFFALLGTLSRKENVLRKF